MPEDNSNSLGKVWANFFKKVNSTPEAIWNNYNLLGHFLKLFKAQYGFDYSMSYKSQPAKCQEIIVIKKLFASLNTNNWQRVKDYIDWNFEKKIKPKNYKMKSITYFLSPTLINEYKYFINENNKITKTKELPEEYAASIKEFDLPVKTYGDVQFIKAMIETEPDNVSYKQLMQKLYSAGFEDSMVEGI